MSSVRILAYIPIQTYLNGFAPLVFAWKQVSRVFVEAYVDMQMTVYSCL